MLKDDISKETRTLLNKPLFRIKTEEEFIQEFGERWNLAISHGWNKDMDNMFGTIVPIENNIYCIQLMCNPKSNLKLVGNDDQFWTFGLDMLKRIEDDL